jgi:hypothetical protein
VAAVSGRLIAGGIGHSVAIFATRYDTEDAGCGYEFFYSSNGKAPVRIVGARGIGAAIEDEFLSIYSRAEHVAADFNFGFSVAPEPTPPTPATRESIADELMLKASLDDSLHTTARTDQTRQRDPLDWANIIPTWVNE